jgi:YHYH protein
VNGRADSPEVRLRLLLVLSVALLAAPVAAAANPAALPLGDGHVGSQPARGSVDACPLPSLPVGGGPGGGGANGPTPWIHGSTWDSTAKPAVQGSVHWPAASISVTASGASRIIRTNSLPVGAATGTFPISPSDPAYRYDRNPNSIRAVPTTFTLPLSPRPAATPSCLPFGPIGVATNGVEIFNALDAEKRDAVAHEEQDACGGHPGPSGAYHYHAISSCIATSGSSTLVGYALDGFGIYVERGVTNADLDACHGRTSTVLWNGKQTRIYHYDATAEYPYTLGCFRGATGTISGTR